MRSALAVFSLSIKAPHAATILSSSLAAIAATQGAGSAGGTVAGSAPVATAPCGSAANKTTANMAFRIEAMGRDRIGRL